MEIILRKATATDSEQVLSWRNELSTIPWMASKSTLSFEEHNRWFQSAVNDLSCLLLIIEADHEPAGQLRYNLDPQFLGNAAKVSINITEKLHGKGIASKAFSKGHDLVLSEYFAQQVFARIRKDNIGSIKAMEKAGYTQQGQIEVHGEPHILLIR